MRRGIYVLDWNTYLSDDNPDAGNASGGVVPNV